MATKIIGKSTEDVSAETISTKRAAEVMLRDLGNNISTNGALRHDLANFVLMQFMPNFMINKLFYNELNAK